MKHWSQIVVVLVLVALGPSPVWAAPEVTVSEGRLTTVGVELLVIEGSPGTAIVRREGVELIMGEPGYGQFFGEARGVVLELSPGEYTVRAWGPIPIEGPPRPDASFVFTVPAPDRLRQIRLAWNRLTAAAAARQAALEEHAAAVQAWRSLAPTITEIVATQQGD